MNPRYELLYIIPTTFTDDEAGTIELKVQALLEKAGATVEVTRRLGKYRLAYAINKQRHGHYVMCYFTAPGPSLAKVDELLRIQVDILRHLVLRADEAGDDKFNLVQFAEVIVEGGTRRDDRRREKSSDDRGADKEDLKEGVAVLEKKEETEDIKPETSEPTMTITTSAALSEAELESKIESALSDDMKGV